MTYRFLLLAALVVCHEFALAEVRLNELMASNGAVIADEDGDFEDWIELVNTGSESVDLSGWGLSDNENNPFKWTFPSGTSIGPDEFLVVWASGKDRNDPSGPLHTNYSISSAGEPISLTRPDNSQADFVAATAIPRDISYGRQPDGGGDWFFFDEPSPGSANTGTAYGEVLEPPVFSHEAGFYTDEFQLTISHPEPDVTILYTLDGSEPRESALDGSTYGYKLRYPKNHGDEPGELLEGEVRTHAYSEQLQIRDRSVDTNHLSWRTTTYDQDGSSYWPWSRVFKGTVVRARLIREGAIPGPVVSHTYFITPQGAGRYSLPVISIAADEEGFFGHENGIYVAGSDFEAWRAQTSATANGGSPANYRRRGPEAERAVHFEWFEPDGTRAVAQNMGARIHGGWSRAWSQKSLRMYARNSLGGNGIVDYPLIPGLEGRSTGQPIDQYRTIILRNAGNDNYYLRLRDAFMQELVRHIGLDQQGWRPAVHFINGEFWGHINVRERIDRHFIASHHGIDPDHVSILSNNATIEEGGESDRDDFLALRSFIQNNSTSNPQNFATIAGMMDVENFLKYHMVQIYFNNTDWPHNNIDYWRVRPGHEEQGSAGVRDGRWRWILFDTDFGFGLWGGNASVNTLAHATNPNSSSPWSTVMLRRLLYNEGVRNDFINSFADHMATTFRSSRVNQLIDQMDAELVPHRSEHRARWRDNVNTFTAQINSIKDFGSARPGHMRQHLRDYFGLGGDAQVTLEVANPEAGHLRINTIDITDETPGVDGPAYPWTGTYFQGVPVRIRALPAAGYRFAGWVELPDEESPEIEVTLTGDAAFTAMFEEAEPEMEPLVIHAWNFDHEPFAAPSQSVGEGALDAVLTDGAGWLRNTAAQDFDTAHLRVNNPLGATLTFSLPTTGFEHITLAFDTRRSGNGAGLQTLSYTVNGSAWIEDSTYAIFDAAPQPQFFDFSGIEAANHNPDFAVRITFSQTQEQLDADPVGGAAGNNRFDNVVLSGIPLPGTNLPPVVDSGVLPSGVPAIRAGIPALFDLAAIFSDPDDDALAFSATSSRPGIAAVDVAGDQLTITGLAAGESLITIEADDGTNAPVTASFTVLVYPAAHDLSAGPLVFEEWDAANPAMSFPDHMIFLQGEVSDPPLSAPLTRAYQIPLEDAAEPADADFPYAAASRTRINGLGEDGIAFINTGREIGRDLGAALAAIDTTGMEAVTVGFTAETLVVNIREYAIRLQYRVGDDGPFLDVLDADDDPVEYLRSGTAGDVKVFDPIPLPADALDEPYVQLLWRYHYLSGSSSRPWMRLDDITIAGSTGTTGASRLAFASSPQFWVQDGVPLEPVTVSAVDEIGIVDPAFNGMITLALVGDGVLGGTLTVQAVGGVAVFDDLTVAGGSGSFTLQATTGGLEAGVTPPFALSGLPVLLPGGSGSWNDDENWTSASFPTGSEAAAFVPSSQSGNRNVNLDAPVVLGELRVNHTASAARNRIRDQGEGNTLTFDNGLSPALLRIDGSGEGFVEMENTSGTSLVGDLELQVNAIDGNAEHGALRLRETWSGPGGLIKTGPGVASLTGEGKLFEGAVRIEQGVLQVTEPATPAAAAGIEVADGGQLRLISSSSESNPVRNHAFGGTLDLAGSGRSGVSEGEGFGILGALRYEPGGFTSHAVVTNPVNFSANTVIHISGGGNLLELEGAIGGSGTLTKTGGGALALAGESPAHTANIDVANGQLAINGSIGSNIFLQEDGILQGRGSAAALVGTGRIELAPTVLTADSSSVLHHGFRFTQPGPADTPAPAASGNAVLRLTSATPFGAGFFGSHTIDLLLDEAPAPGTSLRGGFFVEAPFDLAAALAPASVRILIADTEGGIQSHGETWRETTPADSLTWNIASEAVDFGGGPLAGQWIEILAAGDATSFDTWRLSEFEQPELADPLVSGPEADPTRSGVVNLMRYALGLGRNDPPHAALPTLTQDVGFRFPFDPEKTDIIYRVVASADLSDWSTVIYDSSTDTETIPESGHITLPVEFADSATRFLRLVVELEQ